MTWSTFSFKNISFGVMLHRVTLIVGPPPRLTSFLIIFSQISSDFLKFPQIFSNFLKFSQISSNVLKFPLKFSTSSKPG